MRTDASAIARRIVLVTPSERQELATLREAGFTGYLVKPLRAASLAARFNTAPDDFVLDSVDATDARAGISLPDDGSAILVAEDNEINALLARALLSRLGHRPTIANNGAVAVEAWLAAVRPATPYGLVLMDVQMPAPMGSRPRAAFALPKPKAAAPDADHRAHRQRFRTRTARPVSPPAWTVS